MPKGKENYPKMVRCPERLVLASGFGWVSVHTKGITF